MGLGLLCALGLSIPSVLGKESFEQARRGKFTTLSTKYGLMSCRNGVAEIGGGGKSGEASLRMFGGQDAELKLDLKDTPSREVRLSAWAERWTGQAPFEFSIVAIGPNGEKKILEKDIPEHTVGVEFILNTLINPEYGAIKSLEEINAVGHRMVHGGERFSESVLLNKEVLEAFIACNDLAPLHNPANLKGVNAVSAILPNIPQVGVFDTAFHQTMPDYAYMYAIPYEMYEKYGVRRYGFHGTSHRYVSKRVCEFLGVNPVGQKIITCHIGNGGSIAAIKDGKCIDTTMGLTPLEGLMMGTRSGDIDAGAVTFIMEKEGLNTTGVSNLLNKKSGVLGISGVSSDMRELLAACANGNERAILAEKMYYYRIKKYIGAYAAALGGVDIILFTGGVGENQFECRESVCKDMEFMGIKLDNNVNAKVRGEEAIISTADSKVKVVVIPTDEELLIASDTMDILKK